ncbi:MAG: ABC transporter ATP-binding protein [Rhodocyclaceae bacterium]|nr:ABC transporter ATP-binding protein [Rhodocyclaceae bacterium]
MIAISIENLVKTYPRSWASGPVAAVRDISLTVKSGEVFGFIGPNGAGKSTTIKILTGAMAATGGSVSLFGTPVDRPEARRGMGYVPENPSLPDYLSPLEILQMALELHGLGLPNARAHCMAWLERFELAHVATTTIRTFSKGMAQRTALAHALVVNPRLLILDEPLSGLDPVGRRDVVDVLAEYKRNGGTIFLTSHVLHDVERLADRFGLIHKGVLMTIDSPTELVSNEPMYTVRSVGHAALSGLRAEASGRWSAEVAGAELWPLLERLKSAGHQLVEVKPSLTLETAFMRYLGIDQKSEERSA